jgi:predicted small lipoprotein YifL
MSYICLANKNIKNQKSMKRLAFLSLAAVVMALSLASCGSRGHGKCPAYNGAVEPANDIETEYAFADTQK